MTKKFPCLQRIADYIMIERNDFSYFDVQQKQIDEHDVHRHFLLERERSK